MHGRLKSVWLQIATLKISQHFIPKVDLAVIDILEYDEKEYLGGLKNGLKNLQDNISMSSVHEFLWSEFFN